MRARNIKPGFYKNEDLAECSLAARLLYPGLWMMCDRDGRMEYRPKRIKAEIFPFDAFDVHPLLDELERYGLIKKYSSGTVQYLWIPGFLKHQVPHCREKNSVIPPHPEDESTVQAQCQHSADTNLAQCQHPLNPDSLNPSLREVVSPSGICPQPPATDPASPENESIHPRQEMPESLEPDSRKACPREHPPDCPHERIIALYHETLPELARVKTWDEHRKGLLRTRWRETWERLKKGGHAHGPDDLLAWWRKYFATVRTYPWLMGKESGRDGRPFYANLEWLVRPRNYAKVLEGFYRDRRPAA